MRFSKLIASLLSATALAFATAPNAAQLGVSSVTASSTFFTYDSINLINGNGLSGNLHSGDFTTKWMTNNTPTGWLVFDLGGIYNVATSSVWNYGEGCCDVNRSTRDLNVEGSLDGISYFNIASFLLSKPVGDPFAGEILSLNATARYFRFNLNSNYGASYIGLGEVQFEGGAVPEPGALALLALGLVGVAAARARKQ